MSIVAPAWTGRLWHRIARWAVPDLALRLPRYRPITLADVDRIGREVFGSVIAEILSQRPKFRDAIEWVKR